MPSETTRNGGVSGWSEPTADHSLVMLPRAHAEIRQGIQQLVDAIRPTLGPLARAVAFSRSKRSLAPELLDCGGLIARRILEIPGKTRNTGAMLVRDVVWKQYERYGDSSATAAVLFESIYSDGLRFCAAGGSVMRLRQHLETHLDRLIEALRQQAVPVRGTGQTRALAHSLCSESQAAEALGTVMEVIGARHRLEVQPGQHRDTHYEFVQGHYWTVTPLLRDVLTERPNHKLNADSAVLLTTDLDVVDPRELMPALVMAVQAKASLLVVFASSVSDAVKAFLMQNRKPGQFETLVLLPGGEEADRRALLEDVAVLTGSALLLKELRRSLLKITPDDFGAARRVWADLTAFGLVGGGGDPMRVRQHVKRCFHAAETAGEAQQRLTRRARNLLGGSATIYVGGSTETDINTRKETVARAVATMRWALESGVLPGGGASLLHCRGCLADAHPAARSPEETAALNILLRAMEIPARTILANAGCDAAQGVHEITQAGRGYGIDVLRRRITPMLDAGIFDVLAAYEGALRSAVMGAALALSIDAVVHRTRAGVGVKS